MPFEASTKGEVAGGSESVASPSQGSLELKKKKR